MKKIKPGIWEISEVPEVIARSSKVFSSYEIQNSPKKRTRICAHSSINSNLQEMFIAFSAQSYIRPSAHTAQLESMLIIEGRCKYLKFGNNGCEPDPEKKPNSSGITHIALTVKNIEEMLLKLRENSYFPINHAQLSDQGHVKVCYLVGFEGILIELVEEVRL